MAPPRSKGALKAILVLTFIYIVLIFVFSYVFSFVGLFSVVPATLLATVAIYYVGTSDQIAKISGKGELAVELAVPEPKTTRTPTGPPTKPRSPAAVKPRRQGTGQKFCTSCGTSLTPDTRFCPACGAQQGVG